MASTDFAALETDSLLSLFELDLSTVLVDPKPSVTLYFTSQLDTDGVTPLQYNGNTYTALPIDSEGFEMNSSGSMPRPTLTVGNAAAGFNTLLSTYNNFIGATLTKYDVFYKYLDGKTQGGVGNYKTKHSGWILNKKANHNKTFIKWELKNPLDLENVMIPKNQFTRRCSHIYRTWDTGTSQFVQGTCPYTDENNTFDEFGNATSKPNDSCGKRLSDCQIRFQATNKQAEIPIQAFPLIPRY